MYGWMSGHMNGRRKEVWNDREMDVFMVAWMDERMYGCLNG